MLDAKTHVLKLKKLIRDVRDNDGVPPASLDVLCIQTPTQRPDGTWVVNYIDHYSNHHHVGPYATKEEADAVNAQLDRLADVLW